MNLKVRVASISQVPELCEAFGIRPQSLLESFGFSEMMLQQPELMIPALPAVALLEELARQSDCAAVGLLMAERRKLSGFGVLGILLAHQETLGEALAAISQYRHLLNDILLFQLEQNDQLLLVRLDLQLGEPVAKIQALELSVAITFRFGAAMFGPLWQPSSVHFSHAAPADLKLHKKFFKCPLIFNSDFNGIVFPAAASALKNPQADALLVQHARQLLAPLLQKTERQLAEEIRQLLMLQLPNGHHSISAIARLLGLQPRSLQRRLAEQQLSFSDLVNEVRLELSRQYLANPLYSLQRIADLLGYANASSFTRWFVGHFGQSPSQYRQQVTAGTPGETIQI